MVFWLFYYFLIPIGFQIIQTFNKAYFLAMLVDQLFTCSKIIILDIDIMTLFQQQNEHFQISNYYYLQFKLTVIIMKNSFIHSPLTYKEQEDLQFNETNHLPISHSSSQSIILHQQDQFTRYCTLAEQSLLKNYQCQIQQLEKRSTMNNEKSWQRLPGFIHIIIENLKQLSLTTSSRSEIETLLQPYQLQLQKMVKKIQKNLNGKFGPIKSLLSNFFRDYTDLFARTIDKIGKYHGDKKLKYLIETIVRQVFTQIMRMAYDIRIQSKGLGKNWQKQSALQTYYQLKVIFDKHGQVDKAFKAIKHLYLTQVAEDKRFVRQFEVKINNLQNLHLKLKKRIKSRYIYQWRIKNTAQKEYQNHLIDDMNKQITLKIASVVSSVREEKHHWKSIFSDKINQSFKDLLGKFLLNNQKIFGQVRESNMKIKLALRNNNSNNSFEDKWILNKSIAMQPILSHSSSFSSLSSELSYRSEAMSICYKKLNKCVQERQIQCYTVPNGKQKQCIMIPIGDMGVIQIIWNGNQMISIYVFQFLLRAIENSCQLISEGFYLSSLLQDLSIKINSNSWQKDMFEQYTHQNQKEIFAEPLIPKKSKILFQDIQCIPEQSYLQDKLSIYWQNGNKNYETYNNIQHSKEVNFPNNTNTQNSDFDVQKWLDFFKIAEISIYHIQNQFQEINNNLQQVIYPCFDWKDSIPLSREIAYAIKKQLDFKKKKSEQQVVKLIKNNKQIYAIRINEGFCKFVLQSGIVYDNQFFTMKIKKFLIPLILSTCQNTQKCKKCQQYQLFSLPQKTIESSEQHTNNMKISKLFESTSFYKLLSTDNILQLEKSIYSCLTELIPAKIYSRIIYLIDTQTQWVFDNKCSKIIELSSLSLSPSENEVNTQNPYYSYLKSLLKQHPLFQFSQLQSYQNQYSEHFSIYYVISKKHILLLGMYKKQQQNLNNCCELLNEISSFIGYNNHSLVKGSIGDWTAKMMQIKQENATIHNAFQAKLSQNLQQQLSENWKDIVKKYTKTYLPHSSTINFYKITSKSIKCLNTNGRIMSSDEIIQQLPEILFSHSAVSNQNLILNLKSNSRKNKLKDKQLYFPCFPVHEKQLWESIDQILMRNYQSQSKVMEQRYQKVQKILKIEEMDEIQQQLCPSHRKYEQQYNHMGVQQQKAHLIFNVKLQSGKHFVITLKIQQQYCDSIFLPTINILANKIRQTVVSSQSFAEQLQKQLLKNTISIFNSSLKDKQDIFIKKAIDKFYSNYCCKNRSIAKIETIINNILQNRLIINMNNFILNMKSILKSYRQSVSQGTKYLTYIFSKKYFTEFFDKINENKIAIANIIKGTKILNDFYMRNTQKTLNFLNSKAKIKSYSNVQKQKEGTCILIQLLTRKVNKYCKGLFENYQEKKIQIKQLIGLLGEQYQLTNFPSLKDFLNFAQERLACGISQISHNSCLLKLGVAQFDTVYFSDMKQTQPLQQDFKKIEIQAIPNHCIIYYLRHKNLEIKLKAEEQWLVGLIKHGIIPAYTQYYKSITLKTKLMLKSLPNNLDYAFKLLNTIAVSNQLKTYKKASNQYQHINKVHRQASQKFKQIASKENEIFEKTNNIKEIKEHITQLQKKKSDLNVNYQLKSKTLAMHKLQILIQKKKNIKKQQQIRQSVSKMNTNEIIIEQYANLPIKYFSYIQQVHHKQKASNSQAGRALNLILTKTINKKNQQHIKHCFGKIWKVTNIPQFAMNLMQVRPIQQIR